MIYPFRNIVFDCQQATLLSIKRDLGAITFTERIKLSYHLLYCEPCRRFIAQSHLLDKAGKNLHGRLHTEPPFTLSESARERMKKILGSL